MYNRTPAQTKRQIEDRLFSFAGASRNWGILYVNVDRVDWRSKRHPGSIRARMYFTTMSDAAPLEGIADILRGKLDDIVEVEIIRGHKSLRPQVVVWFEAP